MFSTRINSARSSGSRHLCKAANVIRPWGILAHPLQDAQHEGGGHLWRSTFTYGEKRFEVWCRPSAVLRQKANDGTQHCLHIPVYFSQEGVLARFGTSDGRDSRESSGRMRRPSSAEVDLRVSWHNDCFHHWQPCLGAIKLTPVLFAI